MTKKKRQYKGGRRYGYLTTKRKETIQSVINAVDSDKKIPFMYLFRELERSIHIVKLSKLRLAKIGKYKNKKGRRVLPSFSMPVALLKHRVVHNSLVAIKKYQHIQIIADDSKRRVFVTPLYDADVLNLLKQSNKV